MALLLVKNGRRVAQSFSRIAARLSDSDEPFLLVKFGPKGELTDERVEEIKALREAGDTVPAIIEWTGFSKASVYRALG